ncbi:hypothetical protein WMY93_009977 [Mugilogobius chulae]|uniref:Uncharacterized protein n=1 Tax=Mugilogobius chulae TaxID=88201 RepID=A0AAW0PIE8_9GOBI
MLELPQDHLHDVVGSVRALAGGAGAGLVVRALAGGAGAGLVGQGLSWRSRALAGGAGAGLVGQGLSWRSRCRSDTCREAGWDRDKGEAAEDKGRRAAEEERTWSAETNKSDQETAPDPGRDPDWHRSTDSTQRQSLIALPCLLLALRGLDLCILYWPGCILCVREVEPGRERGQRDLRIFVWDQSTCADYTQRQGWTLPCLVVVIASGDGAERSWPVARPYSTHALTTRSGRVNPCRQRKCPTTRLVYMLF